MGMRFRKSVNLGGGTKLTASKSGLSISGGVKGARTSVSTSGRKRTTVSIPGTGISYTKEHGSHGGGKASKGSSANYAVAESIEEFVPVDMAESISTILDKQTLQSLNEDAFQAYANGFIQYAKEQAETPDAGVDIAKITQQLAKIREETRRRVAAKTEKPKKEKVKKGKPEKEKKNSGIIKFVLAAVYAIAGLALIKSGIVYFIIAELLAVLFFIWGKKK